MDCSRILSLCFLVALAACAPVKTPDQEYQDGLLLSQTLIERYGERSSADDQAYLGYIRERLTKELRRSEDYTNYQIVLLDTDRPLAYSPGGGFVLISKGLVQRFGCEAEFAFAIAHELAHEHLGHTRLSAPDEQGHYRKDLEREADRYALGLVAAAGYDPRLALYALANAYGGRTAEEERDDYPAVQERMALVKTEVERTQWLPPGTVDRRGFQLFKRSLAR